MGGTPDIFFFFFLLEPQISFFTGQSWGSFGSEIRIKSRLGLELFLSCPLDKSQLNYSDPIEMN